MYDAIIREQEARGFIEKVNNDRDQVSVHYIPHHSVKKESSITPIRIVFDVAASNPLPTPV